MLARDIKNLSFRGLSTGIIKWSAGAFLLVALYVEFPGHFWSCTLAVVWVDACFSALFLSIEIDSKVSQRSAWISQLALQNGLIELAHGRKPFDSTEDRDWWWNRMRREAQDELVKEDERDAEGAPKPRAWLSVIWNLVSTLVGVVLAAVIAQAISPPS